MKVLWRTGLGLLALGVALLGCSQSSDSPPSANPAPAPNASAAPANAVAAKTPSELASPSASEVCLTVEGMT